MKTNRKKKSTVLIITVVAVVIIVLVVSLLVRGWARGNRYDSYLDMYEELKAKRRY